ncbi:MAG: hypothetical protein KC549_19305, partial [Myxococcales bacterium]|nr:hypothetical protein [Myxococcales bacterium]
EASGLVASRQHPGVFWTHNDSGDEARVFAVRSDGRILGEVAIQGATHVDWEDVAVDDAGHLYLADFGNNRSVRADLRVYRLPEPAPGADRARVDRVLAFRYPDQTRWPDPEERFDAEALFWARGALYLLTKHRQDGRTALYRFPDLSGAAGEQVLVRVGERQVDADAKLGRVTAADVTPDGAHLVVLTYGALLLFDRPATGDDYLANLQRRIDLDPKVLRQCEAVAWDGEDVLVTNEQGDIFRLRAARRWPADRWQGEVERAGP